MQAHYCSGICLGKSSAYLLSKFKAADGFHQVVSRQFTDRFFDQFTDRALGIRAEEDNLLLFLALDIDPSPHPKFGPSPCPIFIT